MAVIVGGLMALVALASSIFRGVQPIDCLIRGLVAFFIGSTLTKVWEGLVGTRKTSYAPPSEEQLKTKKSKEKDKPSEEDQAENKTETDSNTELTETDPTEAANQDDSAELDKAS